LILKENQLILNLRGDSKNNMPFLSNCHGHYGYLRTNKDFIKDLFKNLSIWNGATGALFSNHGDYTYMEYELDCRNKHFFKSETFKSICSRNDIELIISEDNSENILKEFFELVHY